MVSGDGLSAESLAILRSAGTGVRYARNTTLFAEGDPSTHVLLLETGDVKVTSSSPTGYVCLLAIRGPGELVGEFGVTDGSARAATVTTITAVDAVAVSNKLIQDVDVAEIREEITRGVMESARQGPTGLHQVLAGTAVPPPPLRATVEPIPEV